LQVHYCFRFDPSLYPPTVILGVDNFCTKPEKPIGERRLSGLLLLLM
jgi:hypothetical protein